MPAPAEPGDAMGGTRELEVGPLPRSGLVGLLATEPRGGGARDRGDGGSA